MIRGTYYYKQAMALLGDRSDNSDVRRRMFLFDHTVANSCAMFTKGLTRCLNRFKDSMITIVSSMK